MRIKRAAWPILLVVLCAGAGARAHLEKDAGKAAKGDAAGAADKSAKEKQAETDLTDNLSKLAMGPDEPEEDDGSAGELPAEAEYAAEFELPLDAAGGYGDGDGGDAYGGGGTDPEAAYDQPPYEAYEEPADYAPDMPVQGVEKRYDEQPYGAEEQEQPPQQYDQEAYPYASDDNEQPAGYELPMEEEEVPQEQYDEAEQYTGADEYEPSMLLQPPYQYDNEPYAEEQAEQGGGQAEEPPVDVPHVDGVDYGEEMDAEAAVDPAEATTVSAAKRHEEMKRKADEIKHNGQVEFVDFYDKSFVLPSMHKVARHEVTVKRAQTLQFQGAGADGGAITPSNIIFMGVGLVASVLVVGGVVAGAVVYRQRQLESASGSEHGSVCGVERRIVGRKGTRPRAGGDAEMAYDAHLHHYAQTKQKIIDMQAAAGAVPSASAVGVLTADEMQAAGASDTDDEADVDPGDCSVYECPGLAPTGDIEVANPMFDNGKTAAGKH